MKKLLKNVFISVLVFIIISTAASVFALDDETDNKPYYREAYLLLENFGGYQNPILSINKTPVENIIGGWVLDNRGGSPRTSIINPVKIIDDISTTEGTAFIREFNKITDDIIRADFFVSATADGFFAEFQDEEGNPVYRIKLINKRWHILQSDGTYKSVRSAAYNSETKFRVYINLQTGTSKTYINSTNYGEHELLSDNIMNFRFASDEENIVRYTPGIVHFTANYSVFDDFEIYSPLSAYGWKNVSGSYAVDAADKFLTLKANSALSNSFDGISIKYAAESQIRAKKGLDASMLIKSGDDVAVKVEICDGAFFANGEKLYDFRFPDTDMWYKVRIVGNPLEDTADIYLSGRIVGTVPLYTSDAINKFEISTTSGGVSFDDIKVFAVIDHDDYVPEPSHKANLDDYIVAVNICSLWKNTGYSAGWGCISPYNENKPVIGYYDEGVPETADWEIKFMVEHGIDVQSYCWYNNESEGPVKTPWGGYQLHDGYMYAKYSDYMKYMIMWETNATGCDSKQFRNYILPYWFENYFLDDRYLKIDNKIVINAWSVGNLVTGKYFGSYAGLKAEMDYFRDMAKQHGFDGVILLSSITDDAEIYKCGFVGSMAYNWGSDGYLYSHNVNQNLKRQQIASQNGYYHVPTISIGFNGVPWGYDRTPNITVEDYKKCLEWVRDEYLPSYSKKGSWNERLVWLSTWNEYGEGTYIMPAELCGFGYLDGVRSTFTNYPSSHTDHVPDENGLDRITHLFPQYARRLVRVRDAVDNSTSGAKVLKKLDFKGIARYHNISNLNIGADGSATGKAASHDPILYIKSVSDENPVDISECDAIRINARVAKGSVIQVFFTTEASPKESETNSVKTIASTDKLYSYIIQTTDKDTWDGNLTSLRIDPTSITNTEFYIQNVELIKLSDELKTLTVNGIEVESGILPDMFNSRLLIPYDTDTCVQYNLHTHYTWRKDDGIFILEGNGHKAEFKVGSDKYILDGKKQDMGYTMYLKDGVPMLDFELLAEDFGYEHQRTKTGLLINTPEKKMYEEYLTRSNAAWEFNGLDLEGFVSVHSFASIKNGYLSIDNKSAPGDYNPHMIMQRPVAIPKSEYNELEIRVRYSFEEAPGKNGDFFQLFFATPESGTFDENKSVKIQLKSNDSNGEWVTYKVNLAEHRYWNSITTKLRIDPFDGEGFMDIDYIRFSYNKNNVNRINPLGIGSGNASGTTETTTYYSTGSTLSIVEDGGPNNNPGNQVFLVTSKPTGGYIFFRHKAMLRKGATYKISFDVKALGDANGRTDVTSTLVCDFTFKDSVHGRTDNGHHFGHTYKVSPDNGWIHVEKTFTVQNIDDYLNHEVGFFFDPTTSGKGMSYMVDNFSVVEV